MNKRKCQENELIEHQGESAVICQQILSTDSIRKSMEASVENLYVDIGA